MPTHEVINQSPILPELNIATSDTSLCNALAAFAPNATTHELHRLGELAGRHKTLALGETANRHLPELHTHDRLGNRIDDVQFHPAWHELLSYATTFGLHAAPWSDSDPNAHLMRAAKFYVWAQVEAGHGCPISMTYASIPALRLNPSLAQIWEPVLAHRAYDPELRPIPTKRTALCGMAMTEKQGGTDVRANSTRAMTTGSDGLFSLVGHKWFCSAPMSDAFLVLAQAPGGLTCFFLPRILPDGSANAFMIQRLKDKMGNRSNASAEIELDGTVAWMIGEEGRGVRTIVEMVNHTRLDCMLGS
ncbi:MAG: acyl-CoA dehydrogenase family protein, partial [Vulcanimicrobiaceae bacterium]